MKYIDADKLIAKIQPYYEDAKCKARYAAETGTSSDCIKWDKAEEIYEHILRRIIPSLQQEQPKLPGYNKALLEVKSKVDELYEETSIGLSEYDSGLYNGIAETCMKLRGFIKARLESDERPEVDLKKVVMIDNIVMNMIGEGYNDGFKTRPFYEEVVRRINARKEDTK